MNCIHCIYIASETSRSSSLYALRTQYTVSIPFAHEVNTSPFQIQRRFVCYTAVPCTHLCIASLILPSHTGIGVYVSAVAHPSSPAKWL